MFLLVVLASSGFRIEPSGLKIPPPSEPMSSPGDDALQPNRKTARQAKKRYGIRTFHLSLKSAKNRIRATGRDSRAQENAVVHRQGAGGRARCRSSDRARVGERRALS